jgi:hypothetical protein
MSIKHWMPSIIKIRSDNRVRGALLVLFYLAILVGLLLLYGKGDFSTPKYVYQWF